MPHDAAQKAGIVGHPDRRDLRIAARMAFRVAVDASAAQDAGRSAVILELHQEEVRDYR
jgi:hypothetical protein